jgi:protoheme IX farnesyltransferase
MNEVSEQKPFFQKFHYIAFATAGLIYLLITAGDFAGRTGLSLNFTPWLLLPAVLLVLIAAVFAWQNYRDARWISRPLFISLLVLGMQTFLAVLRFSPGANSGVVAAYLSSALLVHALVLTSAVVAFQLGSEKALAPSFTTPFARLTLLTLGMTFVSMVSGAVETVSGATAACQGWILCDGRLLPTTLLEWVYLLHRVVVGVSSISMVLMLVAAWRTQKTQIAVLVLTTASAILFFGQGLIGAFFATRNYPVELIGLHSATATATWAILTILAIQVGLSPAETPPHDYEHPTWRERAQDFLVLTKPIIVVLLLVTTFGGMIVGAQAWPSLSVIFWTLLGGALAAGGSGAINQYIDRDLDKLMRRTAKRPLAARRLTPAEGLAFGVGLCLLSFYLLAVFTNLLAALLSVMGMFYYVWVYSILLKRSTVQNIVIGGGAGAIPPLVGWAAATGSLTLPALLLFLIIFFWTPPHFWALALLRTKEYESGGIPMMPVVRGERETRKQILIYSVELVFLTLIGPLVGIGGVIYFVSAAGLGGILLALVWKLWKQGYTPKLAYRTYRYTSMYLALIFLAMVIDALV